MILLKQKGIILNLIDKRSKNSYPTTVNTINSNSGDHVGITRSLKANSKLHYCKS